MRTRTTGRYESVTTGGEKVDSFVPFDLPPARPALGVDGKLEHRVREAEQALLRLDLASEMVPSLDWFIYAFVRKEAVISSQIEGTQASCWTFSRSRPRNSRNPTPMSRRLQTTSTPLRMRVNSSRRNAARLFLCDC
jgi:hypothetical protein